MSYFTKLNYMKKLILSFVCFYGLNSCSGQTKLNAEEIELIKTINLNQNLAEKIKNNTNGQFVVAIGNEDREMLFEDIPELKSYSTKLPKAIKFQANENQGTKIVKDFREELKTLNLIIYKSEENYGNGDDTITILQSENKFEPLYFEATNAVNYDMETPDLIEKLKTWDKLYGIEFYGIGVDFLSGEFKTLPKDLKKFSKEMYEFCPDIVDQGVGDIHNLEKAIKESNGFFLWWD